MAFKRKKKSSFTSTVLANALEQIIAADRTPPYRIDEPNAQGDKPRPGTSWLTPREFALELFRQLDLGPVDSRPAEEKS
jgi:hypothetical protein